MTAGGNSSVFGVVSDTVIPAVGSGMSYLKDGFNYMAKNAPVTTGIVSAIAAFAMLKMGMNIAKDPGGFVKGAIGPTVAIGGVLALGSFLSNYFSDEPGLGEDRMDVARRAFAETVDEISDVGASVKNTVSGLVNGL